MVRGKATTGLSAMFMGLPDMGMYTDVARRVLLEAGGPLHIGEIVRRAEKDPAFKPRTKTVKASMWTCIYQEMKKDKEQSPFVRLENSVFDLRDRRDDAGLGTVPPPQVRPIAGMQVVDENGDVVGTAQEVGVAKDQGVVLILRTQSGNDVVIEWSRVGKAGEVILLKPSGK